MRFKRSVFEYDNYRDFLRDAYAYSKTVNKNFSFRYFSRIAGFKSPNILKLVMDGERNLAPESIDKFAAAFKLGKEETFFFRNLVLHNQAGTLDEKQVFAQEMMRSRVYRRKQPLKESQYGFFAFWYFVLIREMVGLPGFKEDYDWISRQIKPAITLAEAKKAVEELLKLGLLTRNENGELRQTDQNIGTPDEVMSTFVAQCHRELMKRASESIDVVPKEKRDISAVTFTVSNRAAKLIKEKIQKVRKEILEIAAQEESPDSVYQLNLQLFPMVELPAKEKE